MRSPFTGLRFARLEFENFRAGKMIKLAIVAISLIPLIYGGLFLLAFLDPYGNLVNVPAAVVNLDKGAVIDDEERNVGQELCDELVENNKDAEPGSPTGYDWHFVDKAEATRGLKNADYYMEMIIPENFTENIASADSDDPQNAQLQVYFNPSTNLIAQTVGSSMVTKIRSELNTRIGQEYFDQIFVKIDDASTKLEDAVDGSNQLKDGIEDAEDGASELADGIGDAKSGSQKVTNGLATLGTGAKALDKGADQLASGTGQIEKGTNKLKKNTKKLPSLTKKLAKGVKDLAKGTGQLSSGASQLQDKTKTLPADTKVLSDGASQVSSGSSQVAVGAAQLKESTASLPDNVAALENGAAAIGAGIGSASDTSPTTLYGGVNSMKAGANSIASGLGDAKDGLSLIKNGDGSAANPGLTGISSGLDQAAQAASAAAASGDEATMKATLQQLASQLGTAAGGVSAYASSIGDVSSGIGTAQAGAQALSGGADALSSGLGNLKTGASQLEGGLSELSDASGQLVAGISDLDTGASQLSSGASALATGSKQLSDSAPELTAGITAIATGAGQVNSGASQLKDGTKSLASGSKTLASGISTLEDGADEVDKGAKKLAGSTGTLKSGVDKLHSGSSSLTLGLGDAQDGAGELASGLGDAVDGAGDLADGLKDGQKDMAASVVNADAKSSMMSQPVMANGDKNTGENITQVANYGTGFAPYFIGLGMWVGALMVSFLISALNNRILMSRASSVAAVMASYIPMAIVCSVQALLLLVAIQFGLHMEVKYPVAFYLFGFLTAFTFAAIIQFFRASLGTVGMVVIVVLLMLQLCTAAGTFPIESELPVFQVLNPILPMTYVVGGFRMAMAGLSLDYMTVDVAALLVFLVLFLALTCLLAIKKRRASMATLYPPIQLAG